MASLEMLCNSFWSFMQSQKFFGNEDLKSAVEKEKWKEMQLQHDQIYEHIQQLIGNLKKVLVLLKEEEAVMACEDKTASKSGMFAATEGTSEGHKDVKLTEGSPPRKRKKFSVQVALGNVPDLDPELVQVRADKAEIERRISAFLERKKTEINEDNRREFCNTINEQGEDGCARTGAVFVPRPGSKSHVPVTRVINSQGPQTRLPSGGGGSPAKPHVLPSVKQEIKQEPGVVPSGVEERLINMESHLLMKSEENKSVFQRLQRLEERMLYLESLSPEYFTQMVPRPKRKPSSKLRMDIGHQNDPLAHLSVAEINERIHTLKARLGASVIKQEPTGSTLGAPMLKQEVGGSE